jgi:hypothetical protein
MRKKQKTRKLGEKRSEQKPCGTKNWDKHEYENFITTWLSPKYINR